MIFVVAMISVGKYGHTWKKSKTKAKRIMDIHDVKFYTVVYTNVPNFVSANYTTQKL